MGGGPAPPARGALGALSTSLSGGWGPWRPNHTPLAGVHAATERALACATKQKPRLLAHLPPSGARHSRGEMQQNYDVVPGSRRDRQKGEDKLMHGGPSDLFRCAARTSELCRATPNEFAVPCKMVGGTLKLNSPQASITWKATDPCSLDRDGKPTQSNKWRDKVRAQR